MRARIWWGVALLTVACTDDGANSAPRLTAIRVHIDQPVLRVTQSTIAFAVGEDQYNERYPLTDVSWTSSTPSVAVTDSGKITVLALVNEQVVIRASSGGKIGAAAMSIFPAPVLTQLDLNLSPNSVPVGSTRQLVAVGTDQSGKPIAAGSVTWSVMRTGAGDATMDNSGRITGVAVGSVTVRASVGSVQRDRPITVVAQ